MFIEDEGGDATDAVCEERLRREEVRRLPLRPEDIYATYHQGFQRLGGGPFKGSVQQKLRPRLLYIIRKLFTGRKVSKTNF